MKQPWKTIIAAMLFWGFVPLTLCMYMLSYTVINQLDNSSYIRYATNGKHSEDLFFNGAKKEIVHLDNMLEEFMKTELEETKFKRQQDLFREILKKENSFKEKILQDPDYRAYLVKHNLTEDDAINYIRKISELDIVMLNASFFLVGIIYIGVYYFVFKYRKRIYLTSGILYLVLKLDTFFSGLLLNALYPHFQKWFTDINYEEYVHFIRGMLPAVIEATITFLMFDTVIQYFVNKKNTRIKYELKNTFHYLIKILELQKNIETVPNVKLVDLKYIPNKRTSLYKFCKKNKQDRNLTKVKLIIEEISIGDDRQINTTQLLDAYNSIILSLKKSKLYMEAISCLS